MLRVLSLLIILLLAGCSTNENPATGDTAGYTDASPDTSTDTAPDTTPSETNTPDAGCAEGCPEDWDCVDGVCEDPDCHTDCFGTMWCENGVVKSTPTGPAPCDLGLEVCDEVTEELTCDHGCAAEPGEMGDSTSFCAKYPKTLAPDEPTDDLTYNKSWEPSKAGECVPGENVSPSAVLAGQVAPENGQRTMEPSVLFRDETFTLFRRADSGPTDIPMEWSGFEVMGQEEEPKLYDDGTHGDLVAGDGLFTRACLSLKAEDWNAQPYQTRYDIWFLDPALRGTETVTDAAPGVRRNDTGFFVSLGDDYGKRRVNGWSLHAPNSCVACQHAWAIAGDVFDFFLVGTRDALGGAGYARVHDNIDGTGFNPDCEPNSHCYDIVDGKEHPEWLGVIWMPWPGVQGLTHEMGHGLLGIEAHDFPGPGEDAWNSGDGMHIDSDTTTTGTLSGPFWDPDRGWPHSVVLEDEEGNRSETYLIQDEAGEFRIVPVDENRTIWADIFLYMMGLLTPEEVDTTYYKLVNPTLTDCVTEEINLVCTNNLVTAEKTIPFTVDDFIAKFGDWAVDPAFNPAELQVGILNISDRPHTTAEITWFSKVYRDYVTSDTPTGSWVDDTPWLWSTQGLSKVTIVTE